MPAEPDFALYPDQPPPVEGEREAVNPIVFVSGSEVRARSVDVAAFFAKEIKHVHEAIRKLVAREPIWGFANFRPSYINDLTGQSVGHYDISRDSLSILAMGFTGAKALRWKLRYIEAFNRMEAELLARPAPAANLPDLSNPTVLLALLTEQAQGRIQDQRRAAEAEAAAAVAQGSLDRLGSTKGSVPIRDAGKILGFAKCDDIFEEMEAISWIYRREVGNRWIGHQDKCRAGLLDHRPHTYTGRSGEQHTVQQVVVTPKGLARLAEIFTKKLLH